MRKAPRAQRPPRVVIRGWAIVSPYGGTNQIALTREAAIRGFCMVGTTDRPAEWRAVWKAMYRTGWRCLPFAGEVLRAR